MALSISFISTSRGLPPGFSGGISGSRISHSRSLRSLGYLFLFTPEIYPRFPRLTPFETRSKYLVHGSYTAEGLKGLLQEGGSSRQEAARELLESLGGTLEAYYFAFGDDDFYVIADMPDNVSATAASLIVNATGTLNAKVVVLLTPDEVDQAVNMSGDYRAPGQ